jgi:hypothetical protein
MMSGFGFGVYLWMIHVMDDIKLLREYAEHRSETAFASLVERYAGLAYSAALRQARDPLLAEEVTQAVFSILAKRANVIRRGTIMKKPPENELRARREDCGIAFPNAA